MNTFMPLATDIMGTRIKTLTGEDVGVVQNIMIDPQNGTIIYVVLCYANFMGKVHRHFAIPREMLAVKYGDKVPAYLEIDKGHLMDAQAISPDKHAMGFMKNNTHCIYELMPDQPVYAKMHA